MADTGALVLLSDLVDRLDTLGNESTIFARKPWSAMSEAVLVATDDEGRIDRAVPAGFAYFLEVNVSREVLEVFGDRPASLGDRTRLLIYYAEFDSFPDWVYEH